MSSFSRLVSLCAAERGGGGEAAWPQKTQAAAKAAGVVFTTEGMEDKEGLPSKEYREDSDGRAVRILSKRMSL